MSGRVSGGTCEAEPRRPVRQRAFDRLCVGGGVAGRRRRRRRRRVLPGFPTALAVRRPWSQDIVRQDFSSVCRLQVAQRRGLGEIGVVRGGTRLCELLGGPGQRDARCDDEDGYLHPISLGVETESIRRDVGELLG